jgi:hypothetical protein
VINNLLEALKMKSTEMRVIVSAIAACLALLGSGIAHAKESENKSFQQLSERDKNKNGGENGGGCQSNCEGENLVRESSVPAVPEPETYALMLAGLGLVCFVARRRKTV